MPRLRTPAPPEEEQRQRGLLSRAWNHPATGYTAASVLVVIVLLGLYVVVWGRSPEDPTPRQAAPPAAAPASTTPPAAGECSQPAGSQTVPVAPPAGAQWELVGFLAAPSAPDTAGPGQVDAATGLRSCFAHTPEGALYAAVNFLGATTAAQQLPAAVDRLTTGPGRQALLDQLAADPQHVTGSRSRYQLAGFAFTSYRPQAASVALAIRGSSTAGLASVPLDLLWSGTDWQVALPADGDLTARASQLPSLTGYVPWGA